MKRVIVESPYAANVNHTVAQHETYARAALHDCLTRGEAPFASHLLYTQPGVLNDNIPAERTMGINAGWEWRQAAELTVFYTDLGWSSGMHSALMNCKANGHEWEERHLQDWKL